MNDPKCIGETHAVLVATGEDRVLIVAFGSERGDGMTTAARGRGVKSANNANAAVLAG